MFARCSHQNRDARHPLRPLCPESLLGSVLDLVAGGAPLLLCAACASAPGSAPHPRSELATNVIIVYADDMGWADLGVQGARGFQTPHLDRLAEQGLRFSAAYVPQPVCTPSRAALLTGCHPMRLGLGERVLFPYSDKGLHPAEQTLAESLGAVGYRSACIGKWHLGHHPPFLPTRQGFHEFFGIPYSNDMDGHYYKHLDFQAPPIPLYRGEQIVERSPDQALYTRRFTDAAIDFVRRTSDEPFFLYLAYPMPHRPIHASAQWKDSSELGLYGDVIQELDDGVGRLMAELEDLGLDQRTIVLFSSDNGPWRQESAGPLRGKKGTTWEGGVRVPLLVRWPGHVPTASVCAEPVSVLDIKPTLDRLLGAPTAERASDGQDIGELLSGRADARSPHEWLAFYRDRRLQALRSGRWKLHVHRPEWKGETHGPLLFDLLDDPGEESNLAQARPLVVERMLEMAREVRSELGDAARGVAGRGVRSAGAIVN